MPLSAGDRLGPYEILAPIGAGGMGEVYQARDTRLQRIVALKTSNQQFSERFEREARAVAALNHPNICTLHDVGPNYLVMEFVEGAPLKGPLPMDEVLRYGIQLAGALEAAHRKGISHRDLKPANIIAAKSGIKVLDFGLAKIEKPGALSEHDDTLTRALTEEGNIVGTLQYMAPEQLQGKPTDSRADIFSFGCVLYEMITGNRAFSGPNKASVMLPSWSESRPPQFRWPPDCLTGRCAAAWRKTPTTAGSQRAICGRPSNDASRHRRASQVTNRSRRLTPPGMCSELQLRRLPCSASSR